MSVVMQAYQYALDPTPTQARALFSHVGGSRFAYNHMLAWVKSTLDQRAAEVTYGMDAFELTPFVNTSHYALRKEWNQRKNIVAPWWKQNSKETYSDATQRLSVAMKNFFDSRTGKRKGRACGFPQFKKRDGSSASVRFTTGAIRVEADRHHVTLPTLGTIHTLESTRKLTRRIQAGTARILAATVSHRGGRWFVSFTVEVHRNIHPIRAPHRIVGVDVGVKTLYTVSDSTGTDTFTVANARNTTRSEQLLRRAQRKLSRKCAPNRATRQHASNRYRRGQKRVTRIHRDMSNRRSDLIANTTTALAKNHDVIVIESLNVAGMIRNKNLAKAISDAAFSEFARQLAYKTQWYGSTLITADRWFPSSKTCSECGAVKTKLSLSEREYACATCGMVLDRDVNAARNLAQYGQRIITESASVSERGGKCKTQQDSSCDAAARETLISPPLVA